MDGGRIIGHLVNQVCRAWEVLVEVSDELRPVVSELSRRHPVFPLATIERLVCRTSEEYREAKIRTFIPLLVRRSVGAQLRYLDDGAEPVGRPSSRGLADA